ncbi:hypothetical protein [Pseudomonas synxantha]|uniref:Uncharacterized protein n=1 Tax=Pseudomonas synxantha TaxID=47883 RepID=A0A5D3FYM0_9PSED|nr:hypothetical protein [Pseudomonas synxantha]TYK53897.1 hypothetical protein FXO26_30380 [Pseudomonas synxantha]TYK57270.1 hypothetical protein FXO26_16240 [Pseudomonas synxantha]
MNHYIEPRDTNGEPIDNEKVKVWYVMIHGAIVAKSESLDIAKRMVTHLDLHALDIENKQISDFEINTIFYKKYLETHVYSAILQLFMMQEREWSDTPNKAIPAKKAKSEINPPDIKKGNF